jgi:hypothetical protein
MVKLSKEFHTIKAAVDFINTLKDVFTSFVVPAVTSKDGLTMTTFFVVYFEERN